MARFDTIAVYIVTDQRYGVLYTGVTSDLVDRIGRHRAGEASAFTTKYWCKRLVWFEVHDNMRVAIQREKSIKRYLRQWKINLIEAENPDWLDLWESIRPGVADGVQRVTPAELLRGGNQGPRDKPEDDSPW